LKIGAKGLTSARDFIVHAIWICISVLPVAGDRVAELEWSKSSKWYMGEVTEIIYEGDLDESTEQGWQNAEREADKEFERLCRSLHESHR
jgi:hypothetical protein